MEKAVKRSIPYVTKNKWVLRLPLVSEALQRPAKVPKHWRSATSLEPWKRQMFALKERFPQGWDPKRRLSRDEMEDLRQRKRAHPELNNSQLGDMYRVSPEAVRRVLRSTWAPKGDAAQRVQKRWKRRGERLGAKPAQSLDPE